MGEKRLNIESSEKILKVSIFGFQEHFQYVKFGAIKGCYQGRPMGRVGKFPPPGPKIIDVQKWSFCQVYKMTKVLEDAIENV